MFSKNLVLIILPIVTAVLGGLVSHYGIPYFEKELIKETYYNGYADDISLSNIRPDFDVLQYSYVLDNLLIGIDEDVITLDGDLEIKFISNSQKSIKGKISGSGTIVDGRAYIKYTGKNPVKNERWEGVAIIYVPTAGPASGYWMSHHIRENGGYYAFGEITLKRL